MNTVSRYFIGRGKLYVSDRDVNGQPTGFEWMGNVPSLALNTNQQTTEHQESYSGRDLTDKVVGGAITASLSFTAEEMTKQNLARFLFGTVTDIAGATVTDESLTASLGKYISLTNINLSSFTSLTTDPAGTTYTEGTDYTVDLKSGMLEILSTGTIVDASALLASYAIVGAEKVSAFTGNVNKDYWLRFAGLNQADNLAPCVIDIPKFRFNPVGSMELINENFNQIDVGGEIQFDPLQPDNTEDGGFFKIQITPVSTVV